MIDHLPLCQWSDTQYTDFINYVINNVPPPSCLSLFRKPASCLASMSLLGSFPVRRMILLIDKRQSIQSHCDMWPSALGCRDFRNTPPPYNNTNTSPHTTQVLILACPCLLGSGSNHKAPIGVHVPLFP